MNNIEPGKLIPINGREAWLTDDTPLVEIKYKNGIKSNFPYRVSFYAAAGWFDRDDGYRIVSIRFPADDPYYAILAAGLPLFDGATGFMPWRGGDEAPADYGDGKVLFRGGHILPKRENRRWLHIGKVGDIIAYEPTQAAQPVSDRPEPDMAHPENLELVRIDGTGEALPVVPDKARWPDQDGLYMLAEPTPDNQCYFKERGNHWLGLSAYRIRSKRTQAKHDPWTPELKERVMACVEYLATTRGPLGVSARAILTEIEPVDPLVAALRKYLADDQVPEADADRLRAELAKQGLRIVFEGDG